MTDKKRICVQDVMKTDFGTIGGGATIAEALDEMRRKKTALLVVDKRDENDEYGLLLASHIARQVLAKDKAPERVNVYEIMAKPLLSVDPDMDIRYCARYFENFGLSRAPVVEHRKIIGIISFTDMVLTGLVNF